jgi:hypothetical protein
MANPGDSITYGSWPSYVLPVQGTFTTSYLYMGDRHANAWGGRVRDSEYVWLPLQFPSGKSLSMRRHPRVSIDTATGAVSGVGSGHAYEEMRAWHSGKCPTIAYDPAIADSKAVQYTCKGAANQQWQ